MIENFDVSRSSLEVGWPHSNDWAPGPHILFVIYYPRHVSLSFLLLLYLGWLGFPGISCYVLLARFCSLMVIFGFLLITFRFDDSQGCQSEELVTIRVSWFAARIPRIHSDLPKSIAASVCLVISPNYSNFVSQSECSKEIGCSIVSPSFPLYHKDKSVERIRLCLIANA